MTWKSAAAGLAHGGAKAGIVGDPAMDPAEKERRIRAFGRAIQVLDSYVPGPDMGTNEAAMAWVVDEGGRAAGLPRVVGGIPLDEIGATGLGLAAAADVAAPHIGLALDGARLAVQGFGAVGQHGARYLAERGVVLVAASDSRGAVHHLDGLDLEALVAHKAQGHPVSWARCGRSWCCKGPTSPRRRKRRHGWLPMACCRSPTSSPTPEG